MIRRHKIYIAGPITIGDTALHCHRAFKIANEIIEAGFVPIVPHQSVLWQVVTPKQPESWLDYDLQLIMDCQALLRLPGESVGADWEIEQCKKLDIPVFYETERAIDYLNGIIRGVRNDD